MSVNNVNVKPFELSGTTVSIAATTATANVAVAPTMGRVRVVVKGGTSLVFLRAGVGIGTTAAVTDTPVLATGTDQVFGVPLGTTYIAAITDTGTASVYLHVGDGT